MDEEGDAPAFVIPTNYEPQRGLTTAPTFRDLDALAAPGDRIGDRVVTPAVRVAVAFARLLRATGMTVPVDTVLNFSAALDAVGLVDRSAVYWSGMSTLLRRPEDVPVYDRAFSVFWDRRSVSVPFTAPAKEQTIAITVDADDDENGDEDTDNPPHDGPSIHLRFSAQEILRSKDFSTYTDTELAEAHALMTRLRLVGARRRSRRLVSTRATRGPIDMRRTVRRALRTGGEPITRLHFEQGERSRRLVLILDVSGSMEPYARAFLRFVHAAVVGRQRVEVFTLGTRLTRVTRELSNRDPDRALARAAATVTDWSGGTRLGEGLRSFNDDWGVRGMARGATVVILSDGWDRGDPAELGEQMARLKRVAHQIVWVNPLKVTPGYAPLARGMATALPYVDNFVEGHSLDAMAELAAVITKGS